MSRTQNEKRLAVPGSCYFKAENNWLSYWFIDKAWNAKHAQLQIQHEKDLKYAQVQVMDLLKGRKEALFTDQAL